MNSFFKQKRVLVTGACGTVGRELVRQLIEDYEVGELIALYNNESEIFFLEQRFSKYSNVSFFLADVRDSENLSRKMKHINVVFHSAAFKHVALCEPSPFEAVQTNILGVQNIIQAATESNVERVIFTSSDKAVNPRNAMGTSKLMGEWLMLQQDRPDDYVIATGEQHSVREFCEGAFLEAGIILKWKGKGIAETGIIDDIQPSELLKKYDRRDQLRTLRRGQTVVSIDSRYFRPTEVDTLLGDPSKAQRKLGWEQKISFKQMIREMVDNDLKDGMREAIWKQKGFTIPESFEANM